MVFTLCDDVSSISRGVFQDYYHIKLLLIILSTQGFSSLGNRATLFSFRINQRGCFQRKHFL